LSQVDSLFPHRQKIDAIDEKLLLLLNDRACIVQEVGKIKKARSAEFYVPTREKAIYERLYRLNSGPFSDAAIESIFREVISASLSLESPVKVAFLGPKATFSHLACLQHFGASASELPSDSIKGVFNAVERGQANFGVVPIENSTEGVVNHTLDLFVDSHLKIYGEIFLEVAHFLLSKADTLEKIKRVYSHPQPIAQCASFLETKLPNVLLSEVASTARAALLCREDETAAAITSEIASKIYQVPILEPRIEDNAHNITRFLIISKKMAAPTGSDKTSVIVSIKDQPGALYKILRHFSDQGINLTKIESRPSKKKAWEYLFHIDMEGHVEDKLVKDVLDALQPQIASLKILGSYPAAQERGQGQETVKEKVEPGLIS